MTSYLAPARNFMNGEVCVWVLRFYEILQINIYTCTKFHIQMNGEVHAWVKFFARFHKTAVPQPQRKYIVQDALFSCNA